jgi:ABC-2 type transport system ATP-binding protein
MPPQRQDSMDIAIRVSGIAKTLRGVRALERVDFEVARGSLTGLIGLNGAGKTTTLRILLGLLAPDRGEITVLGQPSSRIARLAGRVGVQLHGGGLDPALTASETLHHAALLLGLRGADVAGALAKVDLAALGSRRVGRLSAGERQRLALARALLPAPEVLVLDEPITHLDPGAAERVVEVLRAEADRGVAVLLSSHQLEHVERTADQIVLLHRGAVVARGAPKDLLRGEGSRLLVAAEPEARARTVLAAMPGATKVETASHGGAGPMLAVTFDGTGPGDVAAALVAAGCRLSFLAPDRRTLHELFLEEIRRADASRVPPAAGREPATAQRDAR